GKKMSKSKGTFIKAATYLKYLDPEFLRYYYAAKLTDGIEDIDLSVDDFVGRTNSELVGKFANLASRSIPMLTGKLDSTLGELDGDGKTLIENLTAAKKAIMENYESLKFSAAVRQINALADEANRYVEQNQPWAMVKTDLEKTRTVLTAIINAVRILTIYLKPILPKYAEKVEKILNVESLQFADVEKLLVNHKINKFERLFERIDKKQVEKMIEESKDNCQPAAEIKNEDSIEPIAEECTIDDFAKIDMRIAKVLKAESVEGADKLLRLQLDLGNCQKEVLAGIAKAYKPDELVGKIVICLANLKPRKMKFGVSEGMILAAGPGGEDIFVLSADSGVKPGQRVG
ncbi:MAG: methionine--tRNA ligase subunit beta, partial [Planctomycetes bacterium]|nr:methionine--tRNA ligase subunit beta [Planctomycetota bacterium]